MAHFIPCTEKSCASEVAQLVIDNVFRLHGAPDSIISDRGPVFISKFWKAFWAKLGTTLRLSTAFHPQTDGQTERVNQTLEQYLRCFINYQQDNWVSLLPLAEFAYNNSLHSSTNQSPFFALSGYHPRFDLFPTSDNSVPAADKRIEEITANHSLLIKTLTQAKEDYKRHADLHRISGTSLEVGDFVYLNRKNINTRRPSSKLDYKLLGPFPIIEKVNPVAFRLQLPATMKIHPVFHRSLLEKATLSDIPDRTQLDTPQIEAESTVEYEINKILNSRINSLTQELEYLISWTGYSKEENSWEPATALSHLEKLRRTFHLKNPNKPCSASLRARGGDTVKTRNRVPHNTIPTVPVPSNN